MGCVKKNKGEVRMSDTLGIIIGLTFIGAWGTHIVTCLSDGSWGFLIAGALLFPIAIIHGFGLWLGVF
jgi:hypothetical protein